MAIDKFGVAMGVSVGVIFGGIFTSFVNPVVGGVIIISGMCTLFSAFLLAVKSA